MIDQSPTIHHLGWLAETDTKMGVGLVAYPHVLLLLLAALLGLSFHRDRRRGGLRGFDGELRPARELTTEPGGLPLPGDVGIHRVGSATGEGYLGCLHLFPVHHQGVTLGCLGDLRHLLVGLKGYGKRAMLNDWNHIYLHFDEVKERYIDHRCGGLRSDRARGQRFPVSDPKSFYDPHKLDLSAAIDRVYEGISAAYAGGLQAWSLLLMLSTWGVG